MPDLYGAGYGAGRIFEGATSGALRGSLVNIEREEAQKGRDFRSGEAEKSRQFTSEQAAQETASREQSAEIKRRSAAFSKAFEAGSKAPVGSRKKIYEAYYKAVVPGEDPPVVEFDKTGGKEASLTLPDGTVIKGDTERIGQLSRTIAAGAPAGEALQVALKDPNVNLRVEKFAQTAKDAASFSPSPLKKLIEERKQLVEEGAQPGDKILEAYDNKISGVDIDIDNLSPDEIDTWGQYVNLTGKMPSLGRGKQSTKIRVAIVKSAARQALDAEGFGVPEGSPDMTPSEAALEVVATQADTKAIQGSLNFLDKQISSMGSFVINLENQVEKVRDLSRDLETFDTRLLNVPLRTLRGRIVGSPLQAKYDLYLTEIESEIGKLATGSTASIAELSATAQEKWDRIHDKSLSVKDMLQLLDETKSAARVRINSVESQLAATRERIRTRSFEEIVPPEQGLQPGGGERPPLSSFDRR